MLDARAVFLSHFGGVFVHELGTSLDVVALAQLLRVVVAFLSLAVVTTTDATAGAAQFLLQMTTVLQLLNGAQQVLHLPLARQSLLRRRRLLC